MENNLNNKFAKIITNFDDIEIKKFDYYKPAPENHNDNDINKSIPNKIDVKYNNPSTQKPSILSRTNELFNINYGYPTLKKNEESKNIEISNYKNLNENPNKENIGVNANKYYLNNYKSNIKEILYQNKNIINSINSIINNDMNDNSNKNENNKENAIDNYINKKERKTYFNYNEEFQNKMGGKDNYLEKIEKFNQDKNIEIGEKKMDKIKNIQNENINNPNNIIQTFTLGKQDINENLNKTGSFNIDTIIKKEENKIDISNNLNKLPNNKEFYFNYKNNDSFNKINEKEIPPVQNIYKEDSKISNISDSKTDISSTNYNNINMNMNNKNDYILKSNNEKGLKYNNYITSNDIRKKTNDYIYNNKFNTLDVANKFENERENHIKMRIENEEKNLQKLEEEKNQLIKEENERRQIIYNESKNNNNIYNNYEDKQKLNNIITQQDIKNDFNEVLNQYKKIESQLNSLKNDKNIDIYQKYNNNYSTINSNNNYKDYIKDIQNRNEIINNNNLDNINNYFNKVNNFEKINITERSTPKKKSLSLGNKQIEINDYMHNYNSTYKNNINMGNNNLYNKNNYLENDDSYAKKKLCESEKRYNVRSYFQIKDKENNLDINNNAYFNNYINKNNNFEKISSYFNDTNKENKDYNIISNNSKKFHVSLTPNGYYRSRKDDDDTFFTNTYKRRNPIDNIDNLIYNNNDYNNNSKNNFKDEIVKTLSTNNYNNYNTMTQTRFYRNRVFPEPNYENNKLKDLNLNLEYNNNNYENNNMANNFKKQNSVRDMSHLNFDLDKNYLNNSNNYNTYNSNSINNNILNNTYNSLSINTRNNLYQNNKYSDRPHSCRCKCSLRKGKSYNDISKLFETNETNENSYVNSLVKDYRTNMNMGKKIDYGFSSNVINRNNYNNMVYNTFNKNNSLNYPNTNHRNICEKCARKHFYNFENNANYSNTFRNSNTLRICPTCKKVCSGGNIIKRNSNFIF